MASCLFCKILAGEMAASAGDIVAIIERRDTPSVSHARSWPHEAILIQINSPLL